jgi:hypothetical protein
MKNKGKETGMAKKNGYGSFCGWFGHMERGIISKHLNPELIIKP